MMENLAQAPTVTAPVPAGAIQILATAVPLPCPDPNTVHYLSPQRVKAEQ